MEYKISFDQAVALIRHNRKCSKRQAVEYLAGYLFGAMTYIDQTVINRMVKIDNEKESN
jgi:hypothetical protein